MVPTWVLKALEGKGFKVELAPQWGPNSIAVTAPDGRVAVRDITEDANLMHLLDNEDPWVRV